MPGTGTHRAQDSVTVGWDHCARQEQSRILPATESLTKELALHNQIQAVQGRAEVGGASLTSQLPVVSPSCAHSAPVWLLPGSQTFCEQSSAQPEPRACPALSNTLQGAPTPSAFGCKDS